MVRFYFLSYSFLFSFFLSFNLNASGDNFRIDNQEKPCCPVNTSHYSPYLESDDQDFWPSFCTTSDEDVLSYDIGKAQIWVGNISRLRQLAPDLGEGDQREKLESLLEKQTKKLEPLAIEGHVLCEEVFESSHNPFHQFLALRLSFLKGKYIPNVFNSLICMWDELLDDWFLKCAHIESPLSKAFYANIQSIRSNDAGTRHFYIKEAGDFLFQGKDYVRSAHFYFKHAHLGDDPTDSLGSVFKSLVTIPDSAQKEYHIKIFMKALYEFCLKRKGHLGYLETYYKLAKEIYPIQGGLDFHAQKTFYTFATNLQGLSPDYLKGVLDICQGVYVESLLDEFMERVMKKIDRLSQEYEETLWDLREPQRHLSNLSRINRDESGKQLIISSAIEIYGEEALLSLFERLQLKREKNLQKVKEDENLFPPLKGYNDSLHSVKIALRSQSEKTEASRSYERGRFTVTEYSDSDTIHFPEGGASSCDEDCHDVQEEFQSILGNGTDREKFYDAPLPERSATPVFGEAPQENFMVQTVPDHPGLYYADVERKDALEEKNNDLQDKMNAAIALVVHDVECRASRVVDQHKKITDLCITAMGVASISEDENFLLWFKKIFDHYIEIQSRPFATTLAVEAYKNFKQLNFERAQKLFRKTAEAKGAIKLVQEIVWVDRSGHSH